MGKKNAEKMQFWTTDEYKTFREAVKDKPRSYMAFQVLYYTGMRIGELMALTKADIDLTAGTVSISKSYNRLNGEDVISPPKTPKSNQVFLYHRFFAMSCGLICGSFTTYKTVIGYFRLQSIFLNMKCCGAASIPA